MTRLPELLTRLRAETPHLVAATVVHLETGAVVAGGSVDPSFDPAVAAASYAEVLLANLRALDRLGLEGAEDLMITMTEMYVLLRMLGPGHYLCIAVTRAATPGFVRALMRKHELPLREALAALG